MTEGLRLRRMGFSNLMSVGAKGITLDFDRMPGLTAVVGRNGHGKSIMCDALAFNWFGRTIRRFKTPSKAINSVNKKSKMLTWTEFSVDGSDYRLERGLPGHIRLEKDGTDVTRSIAETSEAVCKILRMDLTLFLCAIVNSTRSRSFFELEDKEQRGVVESLFRFTVLSEKAHWLNKKRLGMQNELDTEKAVVAERERSNARIQEQINTARASAQQWEMQRRRQVEGLRLEKAKLDAIDYEKQVELLAKVISSQNDIDDLKEAGKDADRSRGELIRQDSLLRQQLGQVGNDDCPECKQPWPDQATRQESRNKITAKMDEVREQLMQHWAHDKEIEGLLEELVGEHNAILLQLSFNNTRELQLGKIRMAELDQSMRNLEAEVNPLEATLEGLQTRALEPVDRAEVNRLEREIEHHRYVENLCSKRDSEARKKVLRRWLPELNDRMGHYLRMLDLPYKVMFGDDLTPLILSGEVELDFGGLSSGQIGRVNLALNWSFRDVFERMNWPVNVAMVDETLDAGMDIYGPVCALKHLQDLARDQRSVMVITHRDDIVQAADDVLEVRMEGGFTQI